MSKYLYLLAFVWSWVLLPTQSKAQLGPGSDAPDFSVVDINGNSHNLYGYLDQGMTVVLDFSATWCGPCWNYHNSHILKQLWEQYGPSGTVMPNKVMVLFIEADISTNTNCLYGPAGCVGGTTGNWVNGTPYPIVDLQPGETVANDYNIGYFPTLYAVCPDRKVWEVAQAPLTKWVSWVTKSCPMDVSGVATDELCFGDGNGGVDQTVTEGFGSISYSWNNGMASQDITVSAGNYRCTVTDGNGRSKVTDFYTVTGPTSAVTVNGNIQNVPCNGNSNGAVITNTTGGAGGYSYDWSSGQSTPNITNVPAGLYQLIVTDASGCTGMKEFTVNEPDAIDINTGSSPASCGANNGQIVAGAVGGNPGYNYRIGTTTNTTGVFNNLAAGNYTIIVTDASNCSSSIQETVGSVPGPNGNAGPDKQLTCTVSNQVLNGTGSTGNNISYLWTATNGGNITGGGNTLTPTVNAAGTYILKVTDASTGCDKYDTAFVTVNQVLPTANAGADAQITCITGSPVLNGTGSTGTTFTYQWTASNGGNITNGANTLTPTVDAAGTYVLTITNAANGCIKTDTALVIANTVQPSAVVATPANLNCNTSSTTLNGAGSSTGNNFGYAWTASNGGNITGGGNTLTPTVNAAGTYTLVVTNSSNGCTKVAATTLGATTPPSATTSNNANVTCHGGNNGASTAVANNGKAPYNYNWSNGANVATVSALNAGTYSVTITDADQCTATTAVTITQPSEIVVNATATNQTINGVNNGTATAAPTGGNGNYTFGWSNGATTQSIQSLAPGVYTVTITDANGCTKTQSVTVAAFNCVLSGGVTNTQVTCNGAANGTASATSSNATGTVTYQWSNGANTSAVQNLAPGTYTVTISDAANCQVAYDVEITQPTPLVSTVTTQGVSGTGASDGSATAIVSGGTSNYTFLWSNGATTSTINNLSVGSYCVTITDANGCTTTKCGEVNFSSGCALDVAIASNNSSCNGSNNGVATANPQTGGTPFTYQWSNSATTSSISNLSPGLYTVTVTDANGCTGVKVVTITEPAPLVIPTPTIQAAECNTPTGGVQMASTNGWNYNWSNGANTASISNILPGNYTLTVTDANGCTSSKAFTVTANDTQAPVAKTKNIVLELNAQGLATIFANDVNDNSEDNCGIASLKLDRTQFDCANLGVNTVTLTVTDLGGNTHTATATVTVLDLMKPDVTCPSNVTSNDCNGPVTYGAPIAKDNCSSGVQLSLTQGLSSGSAFPVGDTKVTWTAVDGSGNTNTCSFTVTVVNPLKPTTNLSYPDCATNTTCVEMKVEGGDGNYTYKWSDGSNQDKACIVSGALSVTVTDGNGCSLQSQYNITAPLPLNPVVNTTPAADVNNKGTAKVTVNGGVGPFTYEWRDAAGTLVGNSETFEGLPGKYKLTITDKRGCSVTIDVEIFISVSAADPLLNKALTISPNPSQGTAWIRFDYPTARHLMVQVFALDGKSAIQNHQLDLQRGVNELVLDHLPDGLYQVRVVVDNEHVLIRKLAVQR